MAMESPEKFVLKPEREGGGWYRMFPHYLINSESGVFF